MKIYQKVAQHIYLPRLRRLEKEIGCRLVFHRIPERYINAIMSLDMTKTWKNAGLDIERGKNHFTIGKVVNGVSSRFDRNAPEYQSWLGGYTVRLGSERPWSVEDICKLAVADQNATLGWYGDPKPFTTIEGWKWTEVGKMQLGRYSGTLYEGGCTTHSDVGAHSNTMRFRFALHSQAALYNLDNPRLNLKATDFLPKRFDFLYEPIDLRVLIAVFDIKPKVKVVLYGNGALIVNLSSTTDTFEVLKEDILKAMESCEIVEV